MAISYSAEKHTVCNPGSLIASNYGRHIVSLEITDDTDNGTIVKVGKMKSLDLFEIEEATAIDAYIALQGANGLWLVVVNDPKDTCLIYNKPLINEESPRRLTLESNYYNDPEDGAVRGYVLDNYDRFWLSDEGFEGSPTVGATITTITDGKLTI